MTYLDPHAEKLAERKRRFQALHLFVTRHGGAWLTSIPGDPLVRLETLEGSTLPDVLRSHGYRLYRDSDGERIVAGQIVEMILVEGSTVPQRRVHAGICRTERYGFTLP